MSDIGIVKNVQEQLEKMGVIALYLFGSRAQGVANELSDYDFGVLMRETGHHRGDDIYDRLYDLLAPLCPRTLKNDVIDVVFLLDTPLELKMHVVRYGKILYDGEPLVRGRFEEKTMEEYCDFRPLLDQFDKAILAQV